MAKKDFYTTKNCETDLKYYSDKFYKQCSEIKSKYFCLVGGCAKVDINQVKKYNINVIESSLTEFLFPNFNDFQFDNIHYWLEFNYNDPYFKKGVIQSYDKIEFWNKHPKQFCKKHPTVDSNRKIAKRIYKYLKDKNSL